MKKALQKSGFQDKKKKSFTTVFKTRKRRALLQVQRESARGRLQYLRGENNEWSGTVQ